MTAAAMAGTGGKLRAWRMAARVPTLSASVAPVAVGTAVAIHEDAFAPGPALAALLGAVCLQIGANLANDVFDFRKGADTSTRLGPPRAVQTGQLREGEVLAGMWLVFAVATLAGVYLAFAAGWPIVVAGAASIVAAIIYTGGPWPIGYHALGDLFVFVFFGFVAVAGTAYVQAGEVPALAWVAAIPVGATVTAILVVNNLRDIDTDRAAAKTTLAVLMGDSATRGWYFALVALAFAVAIGSWALGPLSPWVLLVLAAVAPLIPPARLVRTARGAPLNTALKGTARFNLAFGLLFAAAIALS